jgi:tetratricopeptide (TPR) repeat protein
MSYAEREARPYDEIVYIASSTLGIDTEFVFRVREGLQLVYLRKYEQAREHFVEIEETFPATGVAAVCDTLVWQALMLENFDFKFDKQYWVSTKAARADLEAALAKPGNEGWEHFLMGGIVGIEAIHTMRQQQYLNALQLAFGAMDHIQKAREASPGFVDLKLADGMYNYWRTVVTKSSKVLPDFGDHRAKGIEQMQEVETDSFFLGPAGTLSLAFTWIEESKYKFAIGSCLRNRKAYPENIINNLVTGSVYLYMKKYDSAMGVWDEILAVDPNNRRVRYWRGLTHLRSGHPKKAEVEFTKYLAVGHLEPYQEAHANYRLGQVKQRLKEYAAAMEHFKAAVKIDNHKSAKKAIEHMKKDKKEGKITY